MNTIIDLNVAANITYNQQQDYAIVFGANAGNVTANIDNYTTNGVTKQVSITTLTDPVRDVLVDWQFSNVGVVTMAYTGPWANVSLLPVSPSGWRAFGVRSIAQYDEVMANVKYTDISGGLAPNPDYNYVTTINDQSGNTRTWTTTLNVIANPTISITGNVQYAEDTMANITVANIVVDPASTAVFTFFANVAAANGEVSNGVATSNSVSISGNATQLNTQIQAGALNFLPASDLVSNVGNAITFNLVRSGNSVNTANANITCVSTHNEYSLTTSYTYDEDTKRAMVFQITDLDTHAISFTSTFTQTAGNSGTFYINGVNQGLGNSAVLSNSKANINTSIVEYLPAIDYTGNVSLAYTQTKALPTGNVTQASNVAITLTCANTNPEIINMISRSYTSNTTNNIFSANIPQISDGPDYGQNYTITLTSPIGKFGNSQANAIAANSYSFTGNLTQVNNEFTNMKFVPNYGPFAGNSTFTYTQVRNGINQVNTTLNLTGTELTLSPTIRTFTAATTDKTFTPTFTQSYWQRANILLVGGGGGGGGNSDPSAFGSGGGGAGEVRTITNVSLPNLLLNIVIGNGGNGSVNGNGSPGGNTYYYSNVVSYYTAVGGGGGRPSNFSPSGGTSGNGFSGGSTGVSGAGGGGGANGVGGDGSGSTRGVGGPGLYSTISGSNVVYGNGGGGGNISTLGVTSTTYGGGGGGGSQLADGLPGTAGIIIFNIQ